MGTRGRIFISYRRGDVPGDARSVCERLERRFGKTNVFMDVDRLHAGQRFDRELDKALSQSDVLIAIIGQHWMELLAKHAQAGVRDFVHDEIAAALKRGIVLIPVLVGREDAMPPLPRKEDLPEDIRELVEYQKHSITHESFSRDAAHLVEAVKAALLDTRGQRPWRAIGIVAVIALMVTGVSIGYWTGVFPWFGPGIPQQSPATTIALKSDEARTSAEEEASRKAEVKKAEEEAKAAEEAAKKKADEDARLKAEAEAKVAEEIAIKKADEATKKAADDAARKATDDEAARRLEQQTMRVMAMNCDRLASSPYDEDRPRGMTGVLESSKIDAAATAACDAAMRGYPGIARFVYQAGRAALGRKDYARAEQLFRDAIGKGSAAALAALGTLYANGSGVPQNNVEAYDLFEKGASLNNSVAITGLGVLYGTGNGVALDFAKARSLYERAAALGNARAMANLGTLYYRGHGIMQDYVVARAWYERAAQRGDSSAMFYLGTIYEDGRGVDADFTQARKWYEQAAALGDLQAMYNIGLLYEKGRGVPMSKDEARKWYDKAMEVDYQPAKEGFGTSR